MAERVVRVLRSRAEDIGVGANGTEARHADDSSVKRTLGTSTSEGDINEAPPPSAPSQTFDVAVIQTGSGPTDGLIDVPPGHCLSRALWRHLRESDRIVVRDGSGPVGLAAYKRADGEVRVVHEFLVDRTLADPDGERVTDMLLSALEMVAYEDGVSCLTFLLRDHVVMRPFDQRGYTSLVLDTSGIWLQRKLGWLGWSETRSSRPS